MRPERRARAGIGGGSVAAPARGRRSVLRWLGDLWRRILFAGGTQPLGGEIEHSILSAEKVPHAIVTEMSLKRSGFQANSVARPALMKEFRVQPLIRKFSFERITLHSVYTSTLAHAGFRIQTDPLSAAILAGSGKSREREGWPSQ